MAIFLANLHVVVSAHQRQYTSYRDVLSVLDGRVNEYDGSHDKRLSSEDEDQLYV